ncbi:hypothetical protein CLCR_11038 [Cladophialophora carrionii]|uniref:Uncharacterized protein n=1 Tax=Cladophialophora carrionii TaxID=86049 RepID=A0A1C1CVN7_9EURO|nr:hypothetical protein CLCR_11038 [Cladophialophora carrionii]
MCDLYSSLRSERYSDISSVSTGGIEAKNGPWWSLPSLSSTKSRSQACVLSALFSTLLTLAFVVLIKSAMLIEISGLRMLTASLYFSTSKNLKPTDVEMAIDEFVLCAGQGM